MSEIEKSARRAQRRLLLNRWLAALGWSLAGAAGLFILAVCVERGLALLEETGRFYGWLSLTLATAALLASAAWALITRESLYAAAARLDQAAGLKERISSGLYCATSEDPFARAVVADAERVSRALPVNHHLPVRVPNSAPWAGGTLFLALMFFWLFPTLDLAGKQEQRFEEVQREERVARAKAAIKPLVAPELAKLREENPELKNDLDELEALKDAKLETPAELRRELMKKVEQIGQKLEQQSESAEMAKINEFKKMMNRLASEPKGNTPVSDLSKALAKGDLKSAQEAIAAIQQQLQKEAKTPEEKQKAEELKKELQKLSDKLGQIAQDDKMMRNQLAQAGLNDQEIKQAMEKLAQKDIEGLKKQLAEKGLSKEQVEKLAQQMKKKCDGAGAASKMAQALGKAAAAGQAGGQMSEMSSEAMQGLTDAAQQLSEMEALEQELNSLKSSLAQVNALKDKIGNSCSSCNGTGMKAGQPCGACQGSGMGKSPGSNRPGPGMGALGQGQGGIAAVEETKFNTVQRKAQVNTQAGSIISKQEFEDGEQFKGEVSKEFVEAAISAQREVADDIANEKIPRPYQRSVSEYFKRSAEDVR